MNDVYRELKSPAHVGQLRSVTRRYLIEPASEVDETWVRRFASYWELQGKVYGLEMSDFTIAIDRETSTITSWSSVKRILPGKRITYERMPELMHQ